MAIIRRDDMQLYDGPRPNPRAVRMMMHEKGLKIPRP